MQALATRIGTQSQVVLLGSVASGKYVDVLLPILGTRLRYPTAFIGRGDMSRGGLMLRSAASGIELDYDALTTGVRPRGPRPPKLEPLTRVDPTTHTPRRGDPGVAVSWGHESNPPGAGIDSGIVEPVLSPPRRSPGRSPGAGAAGPEGLDAVVDCRLRPRPAVHRRRDPSHESRGFELAEGMNSASRARKAARRTSRRASIQGELTGRMKHPTRPSRVGLAGGKIRVTP